MHLRPPSLKPANLERKFGNQNERGGVAFKTPLKNRFKTTKEADFWCAPLFFPNLMKYGTTKIKGVGGGVSLYPHQKSLPDNQGS